MTVRIDHDFDGLLDGAPDAILAVDSEGRILLVNAQAELVFGYSRDELVGRPVDVLMPDGARGKHEDHRARYLDDPQPRLMGAGLLDLVGRRRDGTEFPAEVSLSTVDTARGVLVAVIVRDVSHRKRRVEGQAEHARKTAQADREGLEGQLHQSQRMESLGQLAGGVAHDFNNLLGAILNYASFVADELDAAVEGDSDRPWANVRRDVAQIQAAAELATRLTHQLLAFARREVVRPRVLSLNKVVTELEQMLRRTLGEQVELSIHLAPELWMCLADPGQMEQVLMNLVVNARDAMPDGGRLSIDTHDQEVDEAYAAGRSELPTGRYIRLRVSDTGSGMSPDVLERAFEPFFSMKPKGEGSGLGLATVYGIVRQAGGYAQIYSEVGLGTTFTALLPATELSPAEDDVVPRESSAEGGETVLLVEDGAFMRDVATRILTRHGYQVIAAASGPDAIEAAARHTGEIQLLLTDVVMPKMLGKEVAERIVASRPAIRVLFMSGYAQPVLGSKGTLEPGVTLLEKPFSKVLLLSTVRAVLDAA